MKRITKLVAAASSVMMLATMGSLSVPAFADEYTETLAEEYAANFEGNENAQAVAKYLIENGISKEEADSMMATYLEGQQEILAKETSEGNLEEGVAPANTYEGDAKAAFYSSTKLASSQHYAVIIMNNPKAAGDETLKLSWTTSKVSCDSDLNYRDLNDYECDVCDLANSGKKVNYIVTTTAKSTSTPLGTCTFPLNTTLTTEAELRNALTVKTSFDSSNGVSSTFQVHTYALGDYDHNGIVEKSDYTALMDLLVCKFDGNFHYTNVSDNIASIVNELAIDMTQDGVVDMRDGIAWNRTFG